MMSDTRKMASQVPAVLAEASATLRKTASRLIEAENENGILRNELRLAKIARRMEQRGLEPALDFEQKIAQLKEVQPSKLDALEHAVELTAGGFKLGSLEEPNDNVEGVHGESVSATNYASLDNFILSGRALG